MQIFLKNLKKNKKKKKKRVLLTHANFNILLTFFTKLNFNWRVNCLIKIW